LPTLTTSAPLASAQMGSKHNLYLVTCTREPDCLLGILCAPQRTPVTYTAVAYYANGPIESNRNQNPTSITTVSQPRAPWEGSARTARINRLGDFASSIDAAAASIQKGQIAGTAKVGSEDFVCFKDGATALSVRTDLGLSGYSCTADYWCPSIQV
ncbi:hypothetical protein M011DRAFT_387057, partial [Sporormia fimetaria CBS 119925]